MTEADETGTASRPSGLRANIAWQKLWAGQAVSQVGDYTFATTLVLWVATQLTAGAAYAPIAVSGVLVAAAVPTVLVGPLAGVFIDRWDRKRTMMVCDAVRAGLVSVLLALVLLGAGLPVWVHLAAVYLVVAFASAATQFFNPARFAVIGSVVPEADRSAAFGLSSATANTAAVLGPPLAAPLLFSVGVQWALAVNAASFVVSYLFIRWAAIPKDGPGRADDGRRTGTSFRGELREGWRFVRSSTVLTAVLVAAFLYMFGVGAVNALEVFFVIENLRVEASWLGTVNGAMGVGSIVGALLAARLAARIGDRTVFAGGLVATAVLVAVLARTSDLGSAVVAVALVGMPIAMVNTVLGPILLAETPNRLVGRVVAVMNPAVYLASVCSMAVSGLLATAMTPGFSATLWGLRFHRIDTIFLTCSVVMALSGLVAMWFLRAPVQQPESSDP